MRKVASQPTDVELSFLKVLWEHGPCTVRQVHEILSREKDMGYTTALKMLQTMHEKGLVSRDESERSHVYAAARDRQVTQRGMLKELLDKVFGGSAKELVMMAMQEGSGQDKVAIQELLEKAKKERQS